MTDTKIAIAVALFAIATISGAVAYESLTKEEPPASPAPDIVLRPDTHRLDTAKDGKVTLVEFLDFECEACGAAYPVIEELRKTYKGRVTFAVRYFPLPNHRNARNAAYAVESAARQGKFEAMYQRMFQTQSKWGEQQESMAPLFRAYAEDLGLNMTEYDRDVESSVVANRVQADVADGQILEVRGTPTFFLNGQKLTISSMQDLAQTVDKALEE